MSTHPSPTAARTLFAACTLTALLAIVPAALAAPAQATTSSNTTGSNTSTPGDNRRAEDRNAPAPAANRNPHYDSRRCNPITQPPCLP
ncbi:hypothetical protein ACFVUS_19320 [Nocardia sp. NPDC058058]|uniref:hypothetical protein n=1 Tax=Nocardia sp. NPDC058058 TaxID=3346317 RepID=UPI0036DD692F